MTRQLKLFALIAAVMLLTACQSSPQRAPIEAPGERSTYPDARTYPDRGTYPDGRTYPDDRTRPGEAYPGPTAPSVPAERPGTSRPSAPPNADVAVDAIAVDAQRYMAQGQWKQSLEAAEQGLRIDRRNAEFYRIMGESYRQLGDIPQAERFARQAQRYCRADCGRTRQLMRSLNLN